MLLGYLPTLSLVATVILHEVRSLIIIADHLPSHLDPIIPTRYWHTQETIFKTLLLTQDERPCCCSSRRPMTSHVELKKKKKGSLLRERAHGDALLHSPTRLTPACMCVILTPCTYLFSLRLRTLRLIAFAYLTFLYLTIVCVAFYISSPPSQFKSSRVELCKRVHTYLPRE
ncbi:hypothetical protein F4778DRAFT_28241 [Xylariomycetidae sp. FL2044]|nr:hypothetical protein F4778DRAFT_28241 [Xylariomycetidae sp. FL2044]